MGVLFPEERHPSCSPLYSVACSSLCRVKDLCEFSGLIWHVCWYLFVQLMFGQSCWWDLSRITSSRIYSSRIDVTRRDNFIEKVPYSIGLRIFLPFFACFSAVFPELHNSAYWFVVFCNGLCCKMRRQRPYLSGGLRTMVYRLLLGIVLVSKLIVDSPPVTIISLELSN